MALGRGGEFALGKFEDRLARVDQIEGALDLKEDSLAVVRDPDFREQRIARQADAHLGRAGVVDRVVDHLGHPVSPDVADLLWQIGEEWGLPPPLGREGLLAPRGAYEEGAEYGRLLSQILRLFANESNHDFAMRQFRFFVRTGSPWLQFGHALMATMMKAKNFVEMEQALLQFFSAPQAMAERTQLRS